MGAFRKPLAALIFTILATCAAARYADAPQRLVILANSRDAESVGLAEFYAARRGVPLANVIALPLPESESITWREFVDQVFQPLQDELYRRSWIEGTRSGLFDRYGRRRFAFTGHRLSYLVACRGVPLRIYNDPTLLDGPPAGAPAGQFNRNEASVDAELSLLAQSGTPLTGTVTNPLFNNEHPSSLDAELVVKVSRLDGPTLDSARHLVLAAIEGERRGLSGRYYVDLKGPHAQGDKWFESVLAQLEDLGFDGDVERTRGGFEPWARFDAPVLYFGWHRPDLDGPFTAPNFSFPPGAIALHLHSFSARTLRSAKEGWCGPLVALGVAATVGNVFEPYLEMTHRPNLLLRALSRGWTFGDAAYYSLPALSWQAVAIGDPLYRPFKVSTDERAGTPEHPGAALAAYDIVRRANLLFRRGGRTEALALLRSELDRRPGLVLGLACARMALAAKNSADAANALHFVAAARDFPIGEWALAREAAGALARSGAGADALAVYEALLRGGSPSADARRALLREASRTARDLGDAPRAKAFAAELEKSAAPPAGP